MCSERLLGPRLLGDGSRRGGSGVAAAHGAGGARGALPPRGGRQGARTARDRAGRAPAVRGALAYVPIHTLNFITSVLFSPYP